MEAEVEVEVRVRVKMGKRKGTRRGWGLVEVRRVRMPAFMGHGMGEHGDGVKWW
jgi:hypothetical protein